MPRTRSDNLTMRVEAAIIQRALVAPGEPLVVGVSGGLDSMVLLQLLVALQATHGWKLHVAHFDHQLRGKESAADARFVARQTRKLGLSCTLGADDVSAHARAEKLSVEMAARELRRAFLVKVAEEQGAKSVALAHHADDQIELFFLRLLRGSGSDGLRGMLWKAPSEHKSDIYYTRPLLGIARSELETFAKAGRIEHREDSSNKTLDYERNRVRNQLLPLIADVAQRDYRQPMLRTMETLSAEATFLNALAREWLTSPTPFSTLHVAIQRRLLQEQMFDLGIAPEFELIESLRSHPGEKVCIRPNVSLVRKANGLIELIEEADLSANSSAQQVSFEETGGEFTFGGIEMSWMIIASAKGYRPRAENTEVFDADRIGALGRLRHWRAGDRFQPIGTKRPTKLQDLFTNLKVPASERRLRVLAEAADGQLFWVEGVRISEGFKVTPETKRLLIWQWKRVAIA